MASPNMYIGCAGWAVPRQYADAFPAEGTLLERYAKTFHAVEINSSFYRPHRPSTYARWADSVPDGFVFSVKMPKEITHERKLVATEEILASFFSEVRELGDKLGALLIQLPPSLALDMQNARHFFRLLRSQFHGNVALEPRHTTWSQSAAEDLLDEFQVTRVSADPEVAPASKQGYNGKMAYHRLHGSPRMYYSRYTDAFLDALHQQLKKYENVDSVWCIFDNTAHGFATENALTLATRFRNPAKRKTKTASTTRPKREPHKVLRSSARPIESSGRKTNSQ